METLVMKFILKLIFFGIISAANAEVINGKVISVTDGDTVTVLDDFKNTYKIRIMGIDAPEKSQAFGYKSKIFLSNQIFERYVEIRWNKRDRYGRIIGKIIFNKSDIGLNQIKSGLAWHYKKYAAEQTEYDRVAYSNAEVSARINKSGLWADFQPISPWDFRRNKK